MASVIRHISVNVGAPHEPYELAEFWSQVLDRPVDSDDGPGDDEVGVLLADDAVLLFLRVPDGKPATRNRVHLDLLPESTRDEEVERLVGLGASRVTDHRAPDGRGWVVLADPAGNEFCVERSMSERNAGQVSSAANPGSVGMPRAQHRA